MLDVGRIQTAETRSILGTEVKSLLEQLVSASGTTVEDRYIFSGDQDQAPAYDLNLANPNGVNRLLTAPASRQIQHPSGATSTAAWLSPLVAQVLPPVLICKDFVKPLTS